MFKELPQSKDSHLGFAAVGDITKEDYSVLVSAVQDAVDKCDTVTVLLDMTQFHWEKIDAWASDLGFGHEYRGKISRMAIVGEHDLEKWMAKVARPFYAQEAKYFTDDADAWKWTDQS